MTEHANRAHLTDAQLLARAKAAGWVWFKDATNPRFGPFTGWQVTASHRINCKPDAKCAVLRGQNNHLGFDHDLDCSECGRPIWLLWCNDERLIAHRECFACNGWLRLIRNRGPNSIVVDGGDGTRQHMTLGPKQVPGRWNGCGGTWFTVTFKDGRVVETCDLWFQGGVPNRFWDRLPVNATYRQGRGDMGTRTGKRRTR